MLALPYGIADFPTLIKAGYEYVDRTAHIHDLESLGRHLLFVRPRRFGKSLWLSTLAAYYDLRTASEHEQLFGRLAIGREPTPEAHRYFVLRWDFSWISSLGSPEQIAAALDDYVNTALEGFLVDYADFLPPVERHTDAKITFLAVLGVIRRSGHPLYLLIDEYDNFANEVMTRDEAVYGDLVHGAGPFKALMKAVKAATQGEGLERLFVTGVSPVVMSDLSSGMNMLVDVYLRPELSALCGFKDAEIEGLLQRIQAATEPAPTWNVEPLRATIRDWYNGYSFSTRASERVYNPTMALSFLDHLQRYGETPRQLLDPNLAADQDKLRFVGRIVAGQQILLDVIQSDTPLEIPDLTSRFTLSEMLDLSAGDATLVGSYLFYFGMLTLSGETEARDLRLVPPNLVVRKLYAEQILGLLLPDAQGRRALHAPARVLMKRGEIQGFLRFVEEKIFAVLSNRDYLWMDEHGVKIAFHALLFDDISYLVLSEPELGRGFADLCLLRRFDRPSPALFDLLFEFKYVKPGELGLTGEALRQMGREELERLDGVEGRLAEAEVQLKRYREALRDRYGEKLRLRAYAVVALGFERLVAREVVG
ncbi:MAG: AAA family ATPase [Thermoanaerobaculia bacterium]|nr:AAA family ATPase [Thermoanaerobaculia bacterium]